jgi:hypothetical protein
MKTNVALAAGLCLALAAGPAAAQNEGRGYGGPLYVGPNFSTGGQSTTPDYGAKPAKKKKAAVTRERVAPKPRKAPVEKEVATEKASEPAAEKSTTSTVAQKPAASDAATSETAGTSPVTCKRFDSTAGQTITVPCQ